MNLFKMWEEMFGIKLWKFFLIAGVVGISLLVGILFLVKGILLS